MDLVWQMLAESAQIFILVAGILGLILSLILMLSPEKIRVLNRRFNFWIHVDEKLAFLDTYFKTDRFIAHHHTASGLVMISGSVFFLIFLFFDMDIHRFVDIFVPKGKMLPIYEIVFSAAILLGKLSAVIGIMLGILLLLSAGKLGWFEDKMASGMATQPFIDKLNAFHDGIDAVFLRYPVIFGLAGLVASSLLLFTGIIFQVGG